MAAAPDKWAENVPGRYYVDQECIDCDLCRTTAPKNFERSAEGGYSFVASQPRDEDEERDCDQARVECPVEAIGREGEQD